MTARSARGVPLVLEVAVPRAVLRTLAARCPERFPVLLESVAAGALGRFSILFGAPSGAIWREPSGRTYRDGHVQSTSSFLATLEHAATATAQTDSAVLADGTCLPFCGGWFVVLGYEVAGEIESRLTLPSTNLPFDALALRVSTALIFDHSSDRLYAVAEPGSEEAINVLIEQTQSHAAQPATNRATTNRRYVGAIEEEDPALFLDRVARVQAYIAAGDVYQANLSRAWHAAQLPTATPTALYEQLCATNPAPFAALLQWRDVAIVSSSPERLLEIHGREVSTRPIAGTR
ncbi:MAG: chorismate-binding protein, partial [Pseudomonadales bacterium]|nr:chorismate-binding protein [Pseudomonadales bacterium]